MPSKPCIVTKFDHLIDLVEDLLRQRQSVGKTTTLLICSSKDDFLDQLLTSIRVDRQSTEDERMSDVDDETDTITAEAAAAASETTTDANRTRKQYQLLTATLHGLAASENVDLVFCPSIPTLRAYIAVYDSKQRQQTQWHRQQTEGDETADMSLIIVNVLASHHGSSEFTLQGLSRTFASIVSAAARTKSDLQLMECKDVHDPANPDRGPALWEAQVPLLSGSVRIGGAGSSWAGRMIGIRRIVERWFVFA